MRESNQNANWLDIKSFDMNFAQYLILYLQKKTRTKKIIYFWCNLCYVDDLNSLKRLFNWICLIFARISVLKIVLPVPFGIIVYAIVSFLNIDKTCTNRSIMDLNFENMVKIYRYHTMKSRKWNASPRHVYTQKNIY